ncbi:MAG: acylphosphatase [Gammaproteobacteria bacterium]|nr:acylphosphatase [Gammaproteobacteria bacterium]
MSVEICRRYIVSGRVQGVFFRASTASVAHRLGLRGRARNMPDGNVMVVALGPESAVDELGEWLRHGPPSAQVADVQQADEQLDEWQHLPDFRTH